MKFFKNYGLSITLFALFALSWLGQGIFQWNEFVSAQEAHKQPVDIAEFINEFGASTLENWQSEFLQLFTFVVLATYLIHKDSPQSRDSDDKLMKLVEQIHKKTVKK